MRQLIMLKPRHLLLESRLLDAVPIYHLMTMLVILILSTWYLIALHLELTMVITRKTLLFSISLMPDLYVCYHLVRYFPAKVQLIHQHVLLTVFDKHIATN